MKNRKIMSCDYQVALGQKLITAWNHEETCKKTNTVK